MKLTLSCESSLFDEKLCHEKNNPFSSLYQYIIFLLSTGIHKSSCSVLQSTCLQLALGPCSIAAVKGGSKLLFLWEHILDYISENGKSPEEESNPRVNSV